MNKIYYSLVAMLLLVGLAACNRTFVTVEGTTAARHVNIGKKNIFAIDSSYKKLVPLDKGVYMLAFSDHLDTRPWIRERLLQKAGELTLKQGYTHFAVFKDIKNDSALEKAIKNKTVRSLYIDRIRNNSKLRGVGRSFISTRNAQVERVDTFAVVIMFKNGKLGLDAKQVVKRKTEAIRSIQQAIIRRKEQDEAQRLKNMDPNVRKLLHENE